MGADNFSWQMVSNHQSPPPKIPTYKVKIYWAESTKSLYHYVSENMDCHIPREIRSGEYDYVSDSLDSCMTYAEGVLSGWNQFNQSSLADDSDTQVRGYMEIFRKGLPLMNYDGKWSALGDDTLDPYIPEYKQPPEPTIYLHLADDIVKLHSQCPQDRDFAEDNCQWCEVCAHCCPKH